MIAFLPTSGLVSNNFTPCETCSNIGLRAFLVKALLVSSENPTDLIASLDPTMLYGSAVTLRYALTITNSSLYTDTEQITLYDQDANKISNVLNCYGAYPPGIKSLYELIIKDIKDRGYGDYYIENPPNWIVDNRKWI